MPSLSTNHIFALNGISFTIPAHAEKFFTEKKISRQKYWTSMDNGLEVHKKYININKTTNENIKLALDIATMKLTKIHLDGEYDFIKATIDIIANDERYANISLSIPEYQKMLESKRLEIEKTVVTDSPVIVNQQKVTLAEKIKQLEEKTKELKKKERAKKQAELRKKQKREQVAFLTKINKLRKQINNDDILLGGLVRTLELVKLGDQDKINQLIDLSKKSSCKDG